ASIKKAMIKSAKRVVLLCDSSKFSMSAVVLFARFDQIHQLITSRPISDKVLLANLKAAGVEITIAEPKENNGPGGTPGIRKGKRA
ncbi:MAG: hypothetical protein Q8O15_11130, partial [Rectinemataceae bacterium]|nr:hypothetical protein [Rectinemataceae bacterium]